MIRVLDDNGEEVLDIKERLKLLEGEYTKLKHYYGELREALYDIEDLCYRPDDLDDCIWRLDQIEYIVERKQRKSPDHHQDLLDVD